MEYKIKVIYSIQSFGSEASVWCSTPQSLIIESAERDDISSDGYVSESVEDEELFRRKIVKKYGYILMMNLLEYVNQEMKLTKFLKSFKISKIN